MQNFAQMWKKFYGHDIIKVFFFQFEKKSYKNKVPTLGLLALVDLRWQCGYTTKVQKIPDYIAIVMVVQTSIWQSIKNIWICF
jgi:hypothetical protein